MKRLVVRSLAALALAAVSSAQAADMPVEAPVYGAVIAPAYNWTGWYVGLNAGYGWGTQSINQTGLDAFAKAAAAGGAIPTSFADDPKGFIGGGQFGYNYQINRVVLGLEADWQWADIKASETVKTFLFPNFFNFTTIGEQKLESLGTARLRLGYAPVDPLLLYVTGGLAFGEREMSSSITNPGCPGFCAANSTSDTQAGWTLGGGAEYAFAPHWSTKVEYLYYDLGTLSQKLLDPKLPATGWQQSVDFKGSIVRAGLNFKFGG